jgi:hypothetical protein
MDDSYEWTVEQRLGTSVEEKQGRVGQLILQQKIWTNPGQTGQNRAGKVHTESQAVRNPGQTYHFHVISLLLQMFDHHPVIQEPSALCAEAAIENKTNAHYNSFM